MLPLWARSGSSRRRTPVRSRASTSIPVRPPSPGGTVRRGGAAGPGLRARHEPAPVAGGARASPVYVTSEPSSTTRRCSSGCWPGSTRCPAPSSRPGGTSTRRPSAHAPHVRVERFVPQEDVLPAPVRPSTAGPARRPLGGAAHSPPPARSVRTRRRRVEAVVGGVSPTSCRARRSGRARRVLGEPPYTEAAGQVAAEIAAMPGAAEVAALVEERVGRA